MIVKLIEVILSKKVKYFYLFVKFLLRFCGFSVFIIKSSFFCCHILRIMLFYFLRELKNGGIIMKTKTKRILTCSAIILFCSVILSYGTSSKPETEEQTSNSSSAKEEIIKLYQELIDIRQHEVEQSRYLLELGQGSQTALAENEVKAAEARIQLAEFQGNKETVIKELQRLEQLLTEIRNQLKREVDIGQRPVNRLVDIDARLIEIKIRSLKLKQETAKVTNAVQNESELRMRLSIVNKITDIRMKNNAFADLAKIASRLGMVELMKEILGQINDLQLKNTTTGICAINLARNTNVKEALAIVNMINDLELRNSVLMKIATMDYN